jgi:hypothetical protein
MRIANVFEECGFIWYPACCMAYDRRYVVMPDTKDDRPTATVRFGETKREVAMPTGPGGVKRPADVIGCAISVARLSVGLESETLKEPSGRVRSGRSGGAARADILSGERRSEIAKRAAEKRWGKGNV